MIKVKKGDRISVVKSDNPFLKEKEVIVVGVFDQGNLFPYEVDYNGSLYLLRRGTVIKVKEVRNGCQRHDR